MMVAMAMAEELVQSLSGGAGGRGDFVRLCVSVSVS